MSTFNFLTFNTAICLSVRLSVTLYIVVLTVSVKRCKLYCSFPSRALTIHLFRHYCRRMYRLSMWRDGLVVSVLNLGSEGPWFEPMGHGWLCSKREPVALCTLAYSALHP